MSFESVPRSLMSNFKYGPYDYYQGNDPIIKMNVLFINSIIFLENHGMHILQIILNLNFTYPQLQGLEEEGLLHLQGNPKVARRLRIMLAEGMRWMSDILIEEKILTIQRAFGIICYFRRSQW
jgi:hypothetical protein